MSLLLKCTILFILINLSAQSLHSAEQSQTMTELWATQIGSANEAKHKDLLDELEALAPLEIYLDRANVVIATQRTGKIEEGYYIYIPIASYLPTDGAEWTFTAAGDGIWKYTRERHDIGLNQKSAEPRSHFTDLRTDWVTVDKSELERERETPKDMRVGSNDPFKPQHPYHWMVALFDHATAVPYQWKVTISDGAVLAYDYQHDIHARALAYSAMPTQPQSAALPTSKIPIYYELENVEPLWQQGQLELGNGSLVSYASMYGRGACVSGSATEVYWYSHDAAEKTLISKHNIQAFFQLNGRFYGIGGQNNIDSNLGYIVEFIDGADGWEAIEIYQSTAVIAAHCQLPNSDVIIAIGPQIIRISGDGEYNILVSDTHWHSQIHSIVAAPDGYIYFSMDHFVGRFPIRKTLGDYELLQLADQASE